ncbi:MAG: hypothetical protein LC642_08245 [Verrucomicrobiaceae bacterium]|nr:hypothetical protein [Verrucomicrobiaceae bacterium]
MALLRTIFWFVLFLGATFVFTVLFEHGPFDFRENAKKEYASLSKLVGTDVKNRGDQSDKAMP